MQEQEWTWVHRERIPSDTGKGRKVAATLLERLQTEDWTENDLFAIHLAFEEAIVNAIKHGNKLDPDKHVDVTLQSSPSRIRIEIKDQGDGFCPDEVPDPTEEQNLENTSGRGIMLMRSFMTRISYSRRGNQVVMEKDRG